MPQPPAPRYPPPIDTAPPIAPDADVGPGRTLLGERTGPLAREKLDSGIVTVPGPAYPEGGAPRTKRHHRPHRPGVLRSPLCRPGAGASRRQSPLLTRESSSPFAQVGRAGG